jgi:predicted NAD/FAD-dependent oxidoreductase
MKKIRLPEIIGHGGNRCVAGSVSGGMRGLNSAGTALNGGVADLIEHLIIGAGISGLLLGRRLHDAGRRVVVLEKGRGFGGRMATRRAGEARFDHGAQYFTVRTVGFRSFVDDWLREGVVREWFRHLPQDSSADGYPRYVGVNGMSDVAKTLARGLDVRRECKVEQLAFGREGWTVGCAGGGGFLARNLAVTAPVPQALELLGPVADQLPGGLPGRLGSVRYERGLAVMAVMDGPSGLPGFGGLKTPDADPLSWLADNQTKGVSRVPAVTLHATDRFAEEHWDSPDEVRGPLLLAAARPFLKSGVSGFTCHRWGYTLPANPLGEPFFHLREACLMLAGDGFGGPRVEGAAMSGLAAADHLLTSNGHG